MPSRIILGAVFVLAACADAEQQGELSEGPACDAPAVREVVQRLGEQMRQVSLLAPDSLVRSQLQQSYGELVTPALLNAWISNPRAAPGRQVSSPWPSRIEIRSVAAAGDQECTVQGEVIYVTSTDTAGEGAAREPVTLTVREDGEWRINSYQTAAADSAVGGAPDSAAVGMDAVDVLRRYYAAINARDFRRAYELWGDAGTASGTSFQQFAAGFAETARVQVDIGTPGRIEGAAGSRYIKVPVTINALKQDSGRQRFEGSYTLRRSVVDGASAEQREWHIYSADVIQRR